MPEGDTVWLTAARMHQALAGLALRRGELRVPALATTDLTGWAVQDVAARGKHLLIRFDTATTLHSHLRMDGRWQLDPSGSRWRGGPAHQVRVVLENERQRALGFRIHDLVLIPTTDEERLVGHLGPDLLGPDWDLQEALRRLTAAPQRTLGEALLDQRNLAGIGNLYQNETAFLSGLTPWTPVGEVPDPEAVVRRAQRLMRANRDHPEQSTTGDLRRGATHWVYGREGLPCRRCGTPVHTARLGSPPDDRVAYWCPRCQNGPAPAVDPPRRRSSSGYRRPANGPDRRRRRP